MIQNGPNQAIGSDNVQTTGCRMILSASLSEVNGDNTEYAYPIVLPLSRLKSGKMHMAR
jgi:hypothetical protein